jgi:hypothetical protein
VGTDNHRLAPGKAMSWSNVACAPTLLKEFLDHAQGHPETVSNLGASALVVVIGSKDSFA